MYVRRQFRAEAVTVALVIVALVLLALPEPRQAAFSGFLNHVLLLPFADARSAMSGYFGLRSDNDRLRMELQRARLELASVAAEHAENRELRRLLGFAANQPVDLLPARIIDRDFETLPMTFLLDVGRQDGVVENLPVVTPEGLVGKTVDVGPRVTLVMLYNHPAFSASALLVARGHLEYGVVRPAEGGELHLYLPLRSSSERGDRIVTSGYGGAFPRGIPLGVVSELREDRRLGLQRIDVVEPAVDPGRLTAVFVLLREATSGDSAGDDLRLFWPGYDYPSMAGEPLGGPPVPDGEGAPPGEAAPGGTDPPR